MVLNIVLRFSFILIQPVGSLQEDPPHGVAAGPHRQDGAVDQTGEKKYVASDSWNRMTFSEFT